MAYKETMSRDQVILMDLESMIPEDSECRVIDIFCESLDMVELGFKYSEVKATGCPPYPPKSLLKLYLYGLLNRICSSGKLSIEAKRNIEVIWLINGLQPSKRTLCYFKENNKEALRKVFVEFNLFYKKIGLFGKKMAALDSVKVKANNSKKRNHNKKTVESTLKKTEERISEYMTALDEADKNEGFNEKRELTSEQIKEILAKLNATKEKYESLQQQLEESGETQISETDPASRCMKQGSGKGMDISYNTQVVTEAESKMIVDFETTNNGSDKGQLTEMGTRAKEFLETDTLVMTADTGYHDGKDMLEAEKNGITCLVPKGKPENQHSEEGYSRDKFVYDEEKDIYICPQGQVLKNMRETIDYNNDPAFIYANYSACSNCPHRSKCTKGRYRQLSRKTFQSEVDRLDARFIKRKGEYKKRQEIIEHQFGTIKWVWGFDRYYTKGIDFAQAENALRFTAYNLRRAINMIGVNRLIELMKRLSSFLLSFKSLAIIVLCGIFHHIGLNSTTKSFSLRSFGTVCFWNSLYLSDPYITDSHIFHNPLS